MASNRCKLNRLHSAPAPLLLRPRGLAHHPARSSRTVVPHETLCPASLGAPQLLGVGGGCPITSCRSSQRFRTVLHGTVQFRRTPFNSARVSARTRTHPTAPDGTRFHGPPYEPVRTCVFPCDSVQFLALSHDPVLVSGTHPHAGLPFLPSLGLPFPLCSTARLTPKP